MKREHSDLDMVSIEQVILAHISHAPGTVCSDAETDVANVYLGSWRTGPQLFIGNLLTLK